MIVLENDLPVVQQSTEDIFPMPISSPAAPGYRDLNSIEAAWRVKPSFLSFLYNWFYLDLMDLTTLPAARLMDQSGAAVRMRV